MFASWNKPRVALLAAAVAAALVLTATPSVQALEGIQGRHAIFYPSLELVYQHDDNYLVTSTNEVSADTFIAHAHFALEIPGARQYLRLEYAPQYRNVDMNRGDFEPDDDFTHFWTLDAKLRGSSIFSVDIAHDFSFGNLEVYEIDDNRELYRGGERFWANDIGVDFKWEGSRQAAVVQVGHEDSEFDDPADWDVPPWYELSELRIGGEYRYKFTPMTNFLVGYMFRDAAQDYTPRLVANTGVEELDSSRNELWFGFKGELGRTTTGSARLGFASLDYDNIPVGGRYTEEGSDWDGITLKADVTKSFSRYSKLIFGCERDANYSGFDINTYYVSNRAAFTFTNQPQGARVGWTVAGAFHRNSYDNPVLDPATNMMLEREDDITHLRAEVGYHPLEHLSFRLNYRYEERESNFALYDYIDNLVIFQVQFGF